MCRHLTTFTDSLKFRDGSEATFSSTTKSGSAICRIAELKSVSISVLVCSAFGCDFNRSMQHLVSKNREEDVADEEVPTEDSLLK